MGHPPPPGSNATSVIIPYKNPTALISYYVGIFSLIPCFGLVLAPIAIVLAIIGLLAKRKNPQAHGTAHALVGLGAGLFTLLYHIGFFVFLAMDP